MKYAICGVRWGFDMFHPKRHSHKCHRAEAHYGRCECSASPGSLRRWAWRRRVMLSTRYLDWCIRHGRKSWLQREFEAGDPYGIVREHADRILREMDEENWWGS